LSGAVRIVTPQAKPALLLALATVALYWPAMHHDFINYDDDLYVTANVHFQNGLTLENIKWAFSNPVGPNWHPLTMLSHMLDWQLFGLQPWGHHLTSLLLHALNTALVFLLLRTLTGVVWRSLLGGGAVRLASIAGGIGGLGGGTEGRVERLLWFAVIAVLRAIRAGGRAALLCSHQTRRRSRARSHHLAYTLFSRDR
jgi:hypothetical protein